MVEAGLIGALMLAAVAGYRRARFGPPPSRPQRLLPSALTSVCIHVGFHTAATVAPSAPTAIAFVAAGWTTFILWWKWAARAPDPWNFGEGEDGGDDPGGGGPDGPDKDGDKPGGGGRELDWEQLEREMEDFLRRQPEPVGAR